MKTYSIGVQRYEENRKPLSREKIRERLSDSVRQLHGLVNYKILQTVYEPRRKRFINSDNFIVLKCS